VFPVFTQAGSSPGSTWVVGWSQFEYFSVATQPGFTGVAHSQEMGENLDVVSEFSVAFSTELNFFLQAKALAGRRLEWQNHAKCHVPSSS
jgi:hypothetical protein